MAIDPNKMAAFANAMPPPGADDLETDQAGDAEEAGASDEDMQEHGEGRFGALIPLLEANAEELEACCDEIDPEALMNTGEDLQDTDREIFVESFTALPEDLMAEMKSTLSNLTADEADQLAAHLESEDMVEEGARIAAYLMHVSRLLAAGALDADSEDESAMNEAEDSMDEEMDEAEGAEAY